MRRSFLGCTICLRLLSLSLSLTHTHTHTLSLLPSLPCAFVCVHLHLISIEFLVKPKTITSTGDDYPNCPEKKVQRQIWFFREKQTKRKNTQISDSGSAKGKQVGDNIFFYYYFFMD